MSKDHFSELDGGETGGTERQLGGDPRGLTRRRVLMAAGTASAAGLAGCNAIGDGNGGAPTGTGDGDPTGTDVGTTTETDGQPTAETAAETTTAAEDREWRTYQRDNRNSGFNSAIAGPTTKPTVKWTSSVVDMDGPATVADDLVYAGGSGWVKAFDAETGEEVWSYEVGDWVDAAITIADGMAVFPSRGGKLYALDADDGSERWVRSEVDGDTVVEAGDIYINQGSATVADGTVYVSVNDDRRQSFYGLDLETGEVELVVDDNPVNDDYDWATERGRELFYNTPVIAEGTAYLASKKGNVYAVDLETGQVTWARAPSAQRDEPINTIQASPAMVDGTVYVASHGAGTENGPVLYALDAASGETEWSYRLGPNEHGSRSVGGVLVAHDAVFANNRDGVLHAVERADGTERWTYETDGRIYGAASADAEQVYVGDQSEKVYALDPASGELNWQFGSDSTAVRFVDAAPTPVDGTLYVTADDGPLAALTEP